MGERWKRIRRKIRGEGKGVKGKGDWDGDGPEGGARLGLGGGGLLSWGGPDLGMSWASFRAGGGLSSVGLDGSVFFGGGGLLGTMEGGL